MWLFCELEEQIDALPHSRKATHPISLHIITSTIYHSIFNHHCPQSSENRSLSLCLYKYPVQKLADDCKYRLTVDWEVVSPKSATIWADAQALQFCAILASKCLRILSFFLEASWTMAIGASKIESGLAVVDFLRGYIMIGSKYPGLFASIRGQV